MRRLFINRHFLHFDFLTYRNILALIILFDNVVIYYFFINSKRIFISNAKRIILKNVNQLKTFIIAYTPALSLISGSSRASKPLQTTKQKPPTTMNKKLKNFCIKTPLKLLYHKKEWKTINVLHEVKKEL